MSLVHDQLSHTLIEVRDLVKDHAGAIRAADDTTRIILLIGSSQRIVDDSVVGLDNRGYAARGTTDVAVVTGRFDPRAIDLVVLGGRVPARPPVPEIDP
jgi:hypothetical protein